MKEESSADSWMKSVTGCEAKVRLLCPRPVGLVPESKGARVGAGGGEERVKGVHGGADGPGPCMDVDFCSERNGGHWRV